MGEEPNNTEKRGVKEGEEEGEEAKLYGLPTYLPPRQKVNNPVPRTIENSDSSFLSWRVADSDSELIARNQLSVRTLPPPPTLIPIIASQYN